MAIIGTNLTALAVNDSATAIPHNVGFMVDVDGTLKCKIGDQANTAVVITVIAGVVYPFDIQDAVDTGTTGPTTVFWIAGLGS